MFNVIQNGSRGSSRLNKKNTKIIGHIDGRRFDQVSKFVTQPIPHLIMIQLVKS